MRFDHGVHRDETSVVQAVDLLPTLAAIAGAKPAAATPGIDLSPVLRGQAIDKRPALFWAFGLPGAAKQPGGPHPEHDRAPRLAVRDGPWKLLAEADGSDVQLYDVVADPNETSNVAASQPRIRDRLKARLLAWARQLPRP